MSEIGYIVISEECYGGEHIKVFRTANAQEDAQKYADDWIERTKGKINIIVCPIDIVNI